MSNKTKARLKQIFLSNLGLKVSAIVIAILTWFFVVNVENPATTQTYTTSVKITNADVLTDQGKYYEVVGAQTVSFRVTAKRTIQQKLTNDDFTATADMNYLGDDNEIPITITAKNYSSSVSISATPHYLKLKIGDLKTSQFTVDARTTGTPASGYVVSQVKSDPEVITVTGPKSIVSTIETVTATANVDGISEDQTVSAVPKFYDKSGKTIDTSELTLSADTVNLSVSILNSKTVPVNVKTSGSLPNGEELDSVTVDPQEVTISGSKEDLADIDSIEIPSDVVNLSNITADWETTVDLSSYLPDGVLLVNSDDSKATVTVTLKEEGQKTFDVPTSNLTIQNLGSGLTGTFTSDTVSITISGPNTELSQLDASALTGSVDASGLTDGKHVLAVTLSLSGNLQQTAASTELEIASSRSGSSTSTSSSSSSGSSSSSSGSSSSSKSSSSN